MTGFKSENVELEALPVASSVLNNFKEGGVRVVEIIEHDGKQAVNARELHEKLGNKKQFANWIQLRIEQYGFVENQDFEVFNQKVKNSNGGRSRIEYALSLDMAKELCMVENNEKGRMIRKYFIEVEKKARTQNPFAIPQTYSEALLLAANQAKQIEKQQLALEQKKIENDKLVADGKRKDATIVRMKPKEVFTDAVAGSKGNCLVGEVAKLITQNGYKIGEKQFFAWLRDNGYLGKKGERYNIPNQQYMGKNPFFYIKRGVRQGNSGVLHTTSTTMLTPKGQIYFVNKFLGKGGLQGDLFANGEAHDK
jgi:anti-repressor protein